MNLQTETSQFEPPKTETAWSRVKKALGPIAVVGVLIAKFFAKLKFVLLPLLKFLPILLKSGGTMLLMIWVYTQMWGWQFAAGICPASARARNRSFACRQKIRTQSRRACFHSVHGRVHRAQGSAAQCMDRGMRGHRRPDAGDLGALLCNSLGEVFAAPLFIALAWFGYFLNLFNLTPVGMLDGGRIVTALSRWLWLPGFALLLWFGWKYPNFIVWLIVLLSLPRIYSFFRKRTEEEQRYFEVTPSQRWTMSILYFGLIAVLIFGMHVAQQDLNKHGVRSHGHGQETLVQ